MTDPTDLIERLPTIIRDCRALEAAHGNSGRTFVSDTVGSAATTLEALARENAELRGVESALPRLFHVKFVDGSLWIKVDDFSRVQTFYRAKISALRATLKECADDLAAEIDHRYHAPDVHPAMKRKYDADMAVVEQARALLSPPAPPDGGKSG